MKDTLIRYRKGKARGTFDDARMLLRDGTPSSAMFYLLKGVWTETTPINDKIDCVTRCGPLPSSYLMKAKHTGFSIFTRDEIFP
jgi:hypothetical protein